MVEAMSSVQQLRIVEREWRLNTQKQCCGTAARETLVPIVKVCVSALTATATI
jgi:hypothetical protein